MPAADFRRILHTLAAHGVDFLIGGGVSAVLQGAPVNTFDLDVVHSTAADNAARLLAALEDLDACCRMQPERKRRPQLSHLTASGHQLLATRFGHLGLLGAIGRSQGYRDLLPRTIQLDIGEGVRVRALSLEALIAVKEEAAGEKDLATLPVLRRTLDERRKL